MRGIVSMPPEARDVPSMMKAIAAWISTSQRDSLSCPLRAGLAHYQVARFHSYYDGSDRTARLLTTLILHLGRYDLQGLYSLEEYYARNLGAYYKALTVGPSHDIRGARAQRTRNCWYHRMGGVFLRGSRQQL